MEISYINNEEELENKNASCQDLLSFTVTIQMFLSGKKKYFQINLAKFKYVRAKSLTPTGTDV